MVIGTQNNTMHKDLEQQMLQLIKKSKSHSTVSFSSENLLLFAQSPLIGLLIPVDTINLVPNHRVNVESTRCNLENSCEQVTWLLIETKLLNIGLYCMYKLFAQLTQCEQSCMQHSFQRLRIILPLKFRYHVKFAMFP